ncbi:TPA: mechanosensitive ion channel [Legionella pneumophila]|nr:mechanosensitive ion channel [Legionella pneumophila]HDI5443511.1 mechanosensitive ion channel [Legionella pneumophila]
MRLKKLGLRRNKLIPILIGLFWASFITPALGENIKSNVSQSLASAPITDVSNKVDVKPIARDTEISDRIEKILNATTWYENPKVDVKNGVVFLTGKTKTSEHKQWAESLAKNTQDVVAVVNQIEILTSSVWDMSTLLSAGFKEQWQNFLRSIPIIILSFLILIIFWIIALIVKTISRKYLNSRELHPLLSHVISRGAAFLCVLIGIYLILKLLGLTNIALTILGGTGVLGIILGIAFKNITENLLASVLLSVQNPFKNDDLIEVAGVTGYVQGLTIRATLLMTQDGHEVQIPNAIVYQSNIYNFTSNPNRRETFLIEIASTASISAAQELALNTLKNHPAILQEPEPLVLVNSLTSGNVVLCIYFWLDGSQYNWLKVKSSAIRLLKRAFQDAEIHIPGTEIKINIANEISLPEKKSKHETVNKPLSINEESQTLVTQAEGELGSDMNDIQKQAQQSKVITEENNLLTQSKKTPTLKPS